MSLDQDRIAEQMRRPAVVRLWQALSPLRSVVTFMNTGAHPDDETSGMLAALAGKHGVRLAYACATRGEGGQNALGTEAGADLGALRTREMEAAASVLDLSLHWLCEGPDDPIVDFGFSKSGEETLAKWGRDRTLERFVRIVRQARPDILCPTFLDVPGQHGHHRAMTQAAHEVVRLAADPAAYPEQGLPPWQVQKLYLPAWSGTGTAYDDDEPPPPATVSLDSGARDPVTGATYAQIGQWSRLLHATQGMGDWIEPGPAPCPLHRAFLAQGLPNQEDTIVDGLPDGVGGLAALTGPGAAADALAVAHQALEAALDGWPHPEQVAVAAAAGLTAVTAARTACPDHARDAVDHRLARKERELSRVLYEACNIDIRATAQAPFISPGGSVDVDIRIADDVDGLDRALEVRLRAPHGWRTTPDRLSANGTVTVSAPPDALLSDGYRSHFDPIGGNGPVFAEVSFQCHGTTVTHAVDLERPLAVLPSVAVAADPPALILNRAQPATALSTILHLSPMGGGASPASATLAAPDGWSIDPASALMPIDSPAAIPVTIEPPASPPAGRHDVMMSVGGAPAASVNRSDYRHTGPVLRAAPAHLTVRTVDVALPEGRIGYVGGGNDRVALWLQRLGLTVDMLEAATLRGGDLSGWDTILVGVFAFRTRPDLAEATARLHDWVRAGGNLVTLYHRPWDTWSPERTPPARLQIGQPSLRWRITDETAEVTHLASDHPLLTTPNRIGPDDWAGWQKERGLYFASAWDDAYTPLLSMADPGEEPLTGALLSGRFGEGRHTHTSLVLHIQMERLVEGAFRLMANLLAPARS